jgi:hypothetical protein
VVTDRNTVPVSMGDVRLTFAGVLEIPARSCTAPLQSRGDPL